MCLAGSVSIAHGEVAVSALFGDHMVVQQGIKVPVWGTAGAGEQVTVRLKDRQAATAVGADGRWRVDLEPLAAGGPFEMTVTGSNALTFRDVMVGEVWICSGQSNMHWPVNKSLNADQEIAAADYAADPAVLGRTDHRGEAARRRLRCLAGVQPADGCPVLRRGLLLRPRTAQDAGCAHRADSDLLGRDARRGVDQPALPWRPTPGYGRSSTDRNSPPHGRRISLPEAGLAGGSGEDRQGSRPRPERPIAGPRRPPPRRHATSSKPQKPAVLYNGMIAPLVPYAIRGAIWYQGEANARPSLSVPQRSSRP